MQGKRVERRMATTISPILNVNDIQKSIKFYKALGFKMGKPWKSKGVLVYTDATFRGAEIGLANIHSNPDADFQKWVATPLGAGVMLNFSTTGINAIHAAAVKAGATIESPPMDVDYGRMFTLNDPDGYTLTFGQPPTKKAAKKAAKKPKKAAKKTAKKAK